jgi:G3E family GTPase
MERAAVRVRAMRPGTSPSVKKKDSANETVTSTQPAHSFSRINTLSLSIPENSVLGPKEIERFLGSQGSKLLRAKGFVRVPRKNKHFLLQFAGKRVTWEPASYYQADSYLVLIGLDMNEQNVIDSWDRLFNHSE